MDISVGIIAHNEEKNIGRLLDTIKTQKTVETNIAEVIVVSSSSDQTNDIVRNTDVKLITQKRRMGKASAINLFMQNAKSNILVMCSGDIIPRPDTVEKLCAPFCNSKIGVVASKPIPIIKTGLLGSIIQLQWELHHKISKTSVKFGEMIAFRNVFRRIKNTAADEEYIAMLVKAQGYIGVYSDHAIVQNKGPTSFADYINQRRRIQWGHLALKKKGYTPASMQKSLVLRSYLQSTNLSNLFVNITALAFEAFSRFLGTIDYIIGRDHSVWKMVKKP